MAGPDSEGYPHAPLPTPVRETAEKKPAPVAVKKGGQVALSLTIMFDMKFIEEHHIECKHLMAEQNGQDPIGRFCLGLLSLRICYAA